MKRPDYHRYIPVLAILASMAFFSCNKDDDKLMSEELRVYLRNENNPAAYNEIAIDLVRRPNQVSGETKWKFAGKVSRKITEDIELAFDVDQSLVETYNTGHGTAYILLPEAHYSLSDQGRTTISAGNINSDSLTVTINNPVELEETERYLLPLALTNVSSKDKGAIPSADYNVMYITINSTLITSGLRPAEDPGSNIVDMKYLITPSGEKVGNPQSEVSAFISKTVNSDLGIKISQGADNLVTAFNQDNGTSYLPMPKNAYSLSNNGEALIKAGRITSQPLAITIDDPEKIADETGYLLPLTLEDNGKTYIDETHNTVYVRVLHEITNIDPNQPVIAEGTPMDRTNWSVEVSSAFPGPENSGSNMLDGNNATPWFSGFKASYEVILDMDGIKTVKGFTLMRNYRYGNTHNFSELRLFSSNDGTNWTAQGSLNTGTPGGNAGNPEVVHVTLYEKAEARYFKFELAGTSSYIGIAELNALE